MSVSLYYSTPFLLEFEAVNTKVPLYLLVFNSYSLFLCCGVTLSKRDFLLLFSYVAQSNKLKMYYRSLISLDPRVVRLSLRLSYFSTSAIRRDSYFKYESDKFQERHIGPRDQEKTEMLSVLGFQKMDELMAATIPSSIRLNRQLSLSKPLTETELIEKLTTIAEKNLHEWRSFIGMGYHNCKTPNVIMRNVFENPGKNVIFLRWNGISASATLSQQKHLSRQAGRHPTLHIKQK